MVLVNGSERPMAMVTSADLEAPHHSHKITSTSWSAKFMTVTSSRQVVVALWDLNINALC